MTKLMLNPYENLEAITRFVSNLLIFIIVLSSKRKRNLVVYNKDHIIVCSNCKSKNIAFT